MEQYFDKTALVAEIEKFYNECLKRAKITDSDYWNAKADAYRNVLAILNDALEVKEVDLEKEIENLIEKEKAFVTDNREVKYYNGDSFNHIYELEFIAKHFFELGLKAKRGE